MTHTYRIFQGLFNEYMMVYEQQKMKVWHTQCTPGLAVIKKLSMIIVLQFRFNPIKKLDLVFLAQIFDF